MDATKDAAAVPPTAVSTLTDLWGPAGFLAFLAVEEERGAWQVAKWHLVREEAVLQRTASAAQKKFIEGFKARLAAALEHEAQNGVGSLQVPSHPINIALGACLATIRDGLERRVA